MHSTLNAKPSDDPHDVVVVAPDAVRVAPDVVEVVQNEISNLLRAAARHQADPQGPTESGATAAPPVPPVDTTFRAASVDDILDSGRRSTGRRAFRAIAALLLAVCIGGAAVAWQTFGYAAKKMVVKWVPQFALTTSLPLEKLWPRSQPVPPATEADAADATPAQPPAQTAPEAATVNAAAPTADSAPSPESLARDLAGVSQQVEQLKASIAELKSGQQQMARDLAKAAETRASEQAARSRPPASSTVSALAPRPAARPRKPVAPYSPTPTALPPAPQAAAPYVPRQVDPAPETQTQLPPAPGFTSVPRPPMPVQ